MNESFSLPLIIAHRGASALAPENTIASFSKAVEVGAEGIEFDVRLSKDGVPMVFHDSNLKRICAIDEKVSKLQSGQLRRLDAGSWFNTRHPALSDKQFASETIPTLEETLAFLNTYEGVIYIELKSKESEIGKLAEAVCGIIKTSKLVPQIIVKSFKLDGIARVKKTFPEIETAALFAPKVKTIIRKENRFIEIAHEFGADRLSLHFSLVTKKLMKKAAEQDFPVTIWTVDNSRWVSRAIRLGINHMITNNPARLIRKRRMIG